MNEKNKSMNRPKLPPWIRVKVSCGDNRSNVDNILKELNLNTVCQSARCPNLGECWHKNTATFMILGDQCTRNCKFCAVEHNQQLLPPDPDEPAKVAKAVKKLNLKYIVITSVTRDDLQDGGSSQFANTINEIYKVMGNVGIEVLTPDFNCDIQSLQTVVDARPSVFNHNIETVERLASEIRSKADYRRSLKVLSTVKEISNGSIPTKSGLMVGMGETDEEVENTICEIRENGVSILTIGQYLPPSNRHWPLDRYVHPDTFKHWEKYAREVGFEFVASAPLVRSSYNAGELINFS